MITKYIKLAVLYFFGALSWMVLLSFFKLYCIINVPMIVEGLWTKKVHEDFVENITGALAYDAAQSWCKGRYIYTVQYYPDGPDGMSESRLMSAMVDLESWNQVEKTSTKTTYSDKKHKYVLYDISDGIFMEVFDR